ncbi:MAG: sulfatase, partial [Bacteroidota bacterium]
MVRGHIKIRMAPIWILLLPILFSVALPVKAQSDRRPNFIIIFADDQGYNDLGCFGSPLIKTPNIDQLAAEGIRFTNFYAQPVCGPSRTALMTGCYPLRVAEVGNVKRIHPMVHPKETLLPEIFQKQGYATACIGKWDLNGHGNGFKWEEMVPTRMGFDYWFGPPASNDGGIKTVYRNETVLENHGVTVNNVTKTYTEEALDFMERSKDRPFFLYLAHTMPHTVLGASDAFRGKSQYGLYGDCIEEIDWGVGEIRKKLRELDLEENTVILYTSDNGPWRARGTHGGSCFPLRGGKATTWEGGVRVPAVLWGNVGLQSGVEVNRVCKTMDVIPTFLQMAGIDLPDTLSLDGQDISAWILSQPSVKEIPEIYYYYYYTHLQAVRQGDWKLVLPRDQAPKWLPNNMLSRWRREDMEAVRDIELYNLREDRAERRDVAKDNPQKVQELLALVDKARKDIGDFNSIGAGARFFDEDPVRPDVLKFQGEESTWRGDPVPIHSEYDNGGRIRKNPNHFKNKRK